MEFISIIEGYAMGATYRLSVPISQNADKIYAGIQAAMTSENKPICVDRVGDFLQKTGVTDYMFTMDSYTAAYGIRPNGKPWTRAIELPIQDKTVLQRFVPLVNCAMSTHSGAPHTNITTIADNCADADSLACSLFAMGPLMGFKFANTNAIPASFISKDANGFQERLTEAMRAVIK